MPFFTADPMLHLECSKLRNVDPQDPQNLYGIWSVFSKCSGIMQHGKRLENMSWRLWTHETICQPPKRRSARSSASSTFSQSEFREQHASDVPDLSQSVDSLSDVDASDDELERGESNSSVWSRRRSSNKRMTPVDLENLLSSINLKHEISGPLSPLPTPRSSEPQQKPKKNDNKSKSSQESSRSINNESSSSSNTAGTDPSYASPAATSDTSAASEIAHSVVRGFEGISTYRSSSQLAPPPLTEAQTKTTALPAPTALRRSRRSVFMLGESSDDDSSLRSNMSPRSKPQTPTSVPQNEGTKRKQTSFDEQVVEIPKNLPQSHDDGAAIESSSEEEYDSEDPANESAIEEEDDEDAWEDEHDTEEKPDQRPQLKFNRIDSNSNLSTRRSLITANIHETTRASALEEAASRHDSMRRRSRTSIPNGPSMPVSPTEESPLSPAVSAQSATPPQMINIAPPNNNPVAPPLLSPRSTRRNMLTTELGVSLRKNMLLERQQKNFFNSGLTRRHTSNDVKNLSKYPEAGGDSDLRRSSLQQKAGWNEYFHHGISEYHTKGW